MFLFWQEAEIAALGCAAAQQKMTLSAWDELLCTLIFLTVGAISHLMKQRGLHDN